MARMALAALALGLVVAAGGCAQNATIGDAGEKAGVFFGDVGITGHGNTLTIQRGSRVWKLSIIGDNNRVTVEEDVTLNRIEFWGNGNVVSVPDYLVFRTTEVGSNQIIRRPTAGRPADWGEGQPMGELPPVRTLPPPQPRPEPRPEPPPREERIFMPPPAPEGEPPLK